MSTDFNNRSDIIDSRDINERIEELELLEDDKDFDDEDKEELGTLREMADSGREDWEYGVTLINENYFEEYAQELAEDIGAIKDDIGWPCNCIDWEQAANELRVDYTEIDFNGNAYLVR